MSSSHRFVVNVITSIFFLLSQTAAYGGVDHVPLSPGGMWPFEEANHLALNTTSNRLFTVVGRGNLKGTSDLKVLCFDGSTLAPSAQEVLKDTSDMYPYDLAVSVSSNLLLINMCKVSSSSEIKICDHLEVFNLNTFSASDSIHIPVFLEVMAMDTTRDRLIALGDTPSSATESNYSLLTLDLKDMTPTTILTAMPKNNATAMDAIYDASTDSLFVLFVPNENNIPGSVKKEGFLTRFSISTGALVSSASFAGEFTSHSLAFSPSIRRIAVGPKSSGNQEIPLLDPDRMTLLTPLEESTFSEDFSSSGSVVFADDRTLWIANGNSNATRHSIVSVDITNPQDYLFIADATDTTAMIADKELKKVYFSSQSLKSLYVLSSTSNKVTTQIDVAVEPMDLVCDSIQNNWLLLSNQGCLYVIADCPFGMTDTVPHYSARYNIYGSNPRAGLLLDNQHDRLFAASYPRSQPKVLDPVTFFDLGHLPTNAEAFALDSSQNIIYAIGPKTKNLKDGQVLREIDGSTLIYSRDVLDLPDILMIDGGSNFGKIEMSVDVTLGDIWLTSPSFVLTGPSIQRIDPQTGTRDIYRIPSGTYGNLVVDEERQRSIVTLSEVESVSLCICDYLTFPPLNTLDKISLEATHVFDSAANLQNDVVYYLLSTEVGVQLIEFNLETDTVIAHYPLDFLNMETIMKLGYNSKSDRFCVAAFPMGSMFFFNNPFTSATKSISQKDLSPRVTVNPFQVGAGIGISWEVDTNLVGEISGWVIERKEDTLAAHKVVDEWIRLSPLPLPPDLTWWNDTTAENNIPYFYRVQAITKTSTPIEPGLSGPLKRDSSTLRYDVTIPLLTTYLTPNEDCTASVFISSTTTTKGSARIRLSTAGPFITHVSPESAQLPCVVDLSISIPDNTPVGTYTIIISASDGLAMTRIPLLANVVGPKTRITTPRIFRQPVQIFLSSDSDLSASCLSIRGQIGMLRRTANPTGIIVNTLLPNGEVIAATGVVAPTGEFTTQIPVPPSLPPGEWQIHAAWPGSPESLGGTSQPFILPILNPSGTKESGDDTDFGQVITIVGQGSNEFPTEDLNDNANQVYNAFLDRRFTENDNIIYSSITSTPTLAELRTAVQESTTSRFVLFYLLGNVVINSSGPEFILSGTETISTKDLRSLLETVSKDAQPLLIMDTPYAGNFKAPLEAQLGAHIFSCQPGFRTIQTGVNAFTHWYTCEVNKGSAGTSSFGGALAAPIFMLSRMSPSTWSIPQTPTSNRATLEPYASLQIGSAFTPPRSLIKDRISPRIETVTSSKIYPEANTTALQAYVTDLPFDLPVTVSVDVLHPNGWTETVQLIPTKENTHLYATLIHTILPGQTILIYTAQDSSGNQSQAVSSVEVQGLPLDAAQILHLLDNLPNWSEYDLDSLLFWMQLRWHQ